MPPGHLLSLETSGWKISFFCGNIWTVIRISHVDEKFLFSKLDNAIFDFSDIYVDDDDFEIDRFKRDLATQPPSANPNNPPPTQQPSNPPSQNPGTTQAPENPTSQPTQQPSSSGAGPLADTTTTTQSTFNATLPTPTDASQGLGMSTVSQGFNAGDSTTTTQVFNAGDSTTTTQVFNGVDSTTTTQVFNVGDTTSTMMFPSDSSTSNMNPTTTTSGSLNVPGVPTDSLVITNTTSTESSAIDNNQSSVSVENPGRLELQTTLSSMSSTQNAATSQFCRWNLVIAISTCLASVTVFSFWSNDICANDKAKRIIHVYHIYYSNYIIAIRTVTSGSLYLRLLFLPWNCLE